ncbi:MAG: Exodeoxyribonuclease V alpha chain [uncultured Acidimicrobiales bacterium]|uniref:RecBCD enzyme subunit RecD n=1 Tax=uncultured Acidimicrobiales bacterium TaxID=310071 RepID=A0A6J4I703_9ACTN|nr:MAG: Exodeoxyribonuclease V alpha chain [uncultured Acidimicrobiales bacterium]
MAAMDEVDPFDVRFVRSATGLLREFNDAGALVAADVHVALQLGRLCGETDERVLLAAAFAVRGPRLGHVCVDLLGIGASVVVEGDAAVDLSVLAWPEPDEWVAAVAASPLVVAAGGEDRPLRLEGPRLYLDRYWREERQVARDLASRARAPVAGVDDDRLAAGLSRLFGGATADDLQRRAAETAVRRHLTVVAGGPGTGKTTTVARILALLHEQAEATGRAPLVALVAPTGKAAARLEEAVHEAARDMPVSPALRGRLLESSASTLHRLLGWKPGNRARFRHDRFNRLPHDVVIVDETSMVSLTLMARLLEAVRPTARLVLVGDPEQLASVEAGAVLGDIVGPASDAEGAADGAGVADAIVVLRRVHRFAGTIAPLARAIQSGDADRVVEVLRSGARDVRWIEEDAAAGASLPAVRETVVEAGGPLVAAAVDGDGRAALDALGRFRLLCAHRRGPYGVGGWTAQVEAWLTAGVDGFAAVGEWYAGRPVLYTENDYGLRLYNGDTGVVVASGVGGGLRVAFERRGELVELSPQRLGRVETVHAMTVHKAQGSQFERVALLLPDPTSPILTRELLYTAATRAQKELLLVGTEAAVRAAVERPIARASGLRDLLWESASAD